MANVSQHENVEHVPGESVVFMPDSTGHFVTTVVIDVFANLGKPKKDRSKSGVEGKENAPHRVWSNKSRRATNRNTY